MSSIMIQYKKIKKNTIYNLNILTAFLKKKWLYDILSY